MLHVQWALDVPGLSKAGFVITVLRRFSIVCCKTKPNKSLYANSRRGRKRRQNWCEPVPIGFGSTSDLQSRLTKLKLRKRPLKQYKTSAMANAFGPSNRESECSHNYNNYITHSFDRIALLLPYFGMHKITDRPQRTKKVKLIRACTFLFLTSTNIPTKNACIISLASTECLVSSNIWVASEAAWRKIIVKKPRN